ncbi:MAG: DUF6655 family protein [Solirubrobacterales bacterium]
MGSMRQCGERRLEPKGLLCAAVGKILILMLCGCATQRVTDPQRTATEQFLISEAVREAVAPLSFDILHGRQVFVDDRFFTSSDKAFVLGELRAKLLLAGVQLTLDVRDAEIILEVRSPGVGIDRYDSLIGIPAIGAVAGTASTTGGVPASIVTPEVAIVKEIRQVSFAGVAYVAYWSNTGEVAASGGPSIGRAYRDDWWVLGFGPRTLGNIAPVEHHVE